MGWGWVAKRSPSLQSVTAWHSYNYPKEDWKVMWITWRTPGVLLTSAFFHRKSVNFAASRKTDVDSILIHNFFEILLTSFDSLKIVLIKMFTILMMSSKMATLGLFKITIFWNKFQSMTSPRFITWLELYCRCGPVNNYIW